VKKKQRMKHSPSSLFCRDFLLKVNARNPFEIPQLSHISINLTSRYIVAEKKHSLFPMVSLSLLSGQHPKLLRAKKSVAGFKLKKNSILGCKLTLRRVKMASFFKYSGIGCSSTN
jgi:large subunit ribosomal protein L5